MTKARSFSIFLLKENFDASNSLKEDNKLQEIVAGDDLPAGAVLYVLDNPPYEPWWKSYFGIDKRLEQASKGALVFLRVENRWFALSFGHVYHNLKDTSYEYDFGIRITLNCVDPDKLKSTDSLEPSGAKRQRTQLPTVADLTYFDLDTDAAILKSLTGKVKDEYQALFKHATGSSSIHITSKATPTDLPGLCGKLLELYKADSFKASFPNIQNISPVRDPTIINRLNDKLVAAFRANDNAVILSVPEIVDYSDGNCGTFTGVGTSKVYDDIFIDRYIEYLTDAAIDLNDIGIAELKKHHLVQADEDGTAVRKPFSIFKCLIYDTTLDGGTKAYHLCEGNWYEIETNYVKRLSEYLDPLCKDAGLPSFTHKDEGDYNEQACQGKDDRLCLDKSNVAPNGQKSVEPCDIIEVINGKAILNHIKISTLSPSLSHLFNQGTNSIKLLRGEPAALGKLEALIVGKSDAAKSAKFIAPLKEGKLKIVFGIITPKDRANRSLNLPLFSRISLMRCMKELKIMGIEAEYCFIKDDSPKKAGKPKKRKSKGASGE